MYKLALPNMFLVEIGGNLATCHREGGQLVICGMSHTMFCKIQVLLNAYFTSLRVRAMRGGLFTLYTN
jgi:hypothetical protein